MCVFLGVVDVFDALGTCVYTNDIDFPQELLNQHPKMVCPLRSTLPFECFAIINCSLLHLDFPGTRYFQMSQLIPRIGGAKERG